MRHSYRRRHPNLSFTLLENSLSDIMMMEFGVLVSDIENKTGCSRNPKFYRNSDEVLSQYMTYKTGMLVSVQGRKVYMVTDPLYRSLSLPENMKRFAVMFNSRRIK